MPAAGPDSVVMNPTLTLSAACAVLASKRKITASNRNVMDASRARIVVELESLTDQGFAIPDEKHRPLPSPPPLHKGGSNSAGVGADSQYAGLPVSLQRTHSPSLDRHQSSFTALMMSFPIADRPLRAATPVASTNRVVASNASEAQGRCNSIPQWKDWRLMTWISTRLIAQPSSRPVLSPSAPDSAPSTLSIAATWPRVMPICRSMPNSRLRASAWPATLLERPNKPMITAQASSA